MIEDAKTIKHAKAAVRAMKKARNFPKGTCPCSRHVAMMAENLSKHGRYEMLADEPRHCASSLAVTVELLWKARAALADLGMVNSEKGWVKK